MATEEKEINENLGNLFKCTHFVSACELNCHNTGTSASEATLSVC